jgi:hypothetical protein
LEVAQKHGGQGVIAGSLFQVAKSEMSADETQAPSQHLIDILHQGIALTSESSQHQALLNGHLLPEMLEHRRELEMAELGRQLKLARFQEQEKILHNILPAQIAERILEGERTITDHFDGVSVFFSDIVGFTALSQSISARELVELLG